MSPKTSFERSHKDKDVHPLIYLRTYKKNFIEESLKGSLNILMYIK